MTLDDFLGNKEKVKGKWIPVYGFFKHYFNPKNIENIHENAKLEAKDDIRKIYENIKPEKKDVKDGLKLWILKEKIGSNPRFKVQVDRN